MLQGQLVKKVLQLKNAEQNLKDGQNPIDQEIKKIEKHITFLLKKKSRIEDDIIRLEKEKTTTELQITKYEIQL